MRSQILRHLGNLLQAPVQKKGAKKAARALTRHRAPLEFTHRDYLAYLMTPGLEFDFRNLWRRAFQVPDWFEGQKPAPVQGGFSV